MVLPQLFFLGNRHFLYWKSSTCSATDGRLPPPQTPSAHHRWQRWGLDPHHQLSNLTKSPNSNSSKFPPKSRSRFSSYEQGVAGPQNPRSTTPCLDITGHILFFMRNITGWISMSIEKITGRRFFSIEKITGNFGSSLMNCSTSRQHTGKICSSKDKNSSLTFSILFFTCFILGVARV